MKDLWVKTAQVLIERFKERDENVKLEIFQVFQILLKSSFKVFENVEGLDLVEQQRQLKKQSNDHPSDFIMVSVKDKKITQAIIKYGLKSKNVKVKIMGMKTFAEIAYHYRKSIDHFLEAILPFIESSSTENSNDLIQNSLEI